MAKSIPKRSVSISFVNWQLSRRACFRPGVSKRPALISKGDTVTVGIDFEGVLAVDVPNLAKSGELLKLSARSVFEFRDGKIMNITDIS